MNILVPQGIGDSIWALHKVQSLALGQEINLYVACAHNANSLESRAIDFLKRFRFINSVQLYPINCSGIFGPVLLPGLPAENGYYRYIGDGHTDLPGIDYVLMPNAPLERGIRLENWLPELETNWNIMNEYEFNETEKNLSAKYKETNPYVVFYLGSETGNTIAGHNRGGIWSVGDWKELGRRINEELGLRIVVVGADYDASYFDNNFKDVEWENLIGKLQINETFAVTKEARFVISYQSGIGIVSNYIGVPVGIFWRQRGDSVLPYYFVSFEESMSEAWANPKMIEQKKHLSLIYGKHNVEYIMNEVKCRQW